MIQGTQPLRRPDGVGTSASAPTGKPCMILVPFDVTSPYTAPSAFTCASVRHPSVSVAVLHCGTAFATSN